MIDTKKLRRDIDIALKDAGYGIGVNVNLLTMRDLIDVIDELDLAREERAAAQKELAAYKDTFTSLRECCDECGSRANWIESEVQERHKK
jgi:hypothetical protein